MRPCCTLDAHSRPCIGVIGQCSLLSVSWPAARQKAKGPQSLALRPQQELKIGRDAYAELLSEAPVLRSGPDFDQVQRVSQRIAEAVQIEPLQREINLHIADYPFEWEYCVIESRQINAFCLPGGKIGVFTGLLRVVKNDDQLAAVLAHEVAHAVAHHASERIARAQSGRRGLFALAFDREQESEADHIGVFLMTFADYDPQEAVEFWKQMERVRRSRPQIPEILSDHPSDQRRINQLQAWVPMAVAAKKAYVEGRVLPARR
jgi:predicted Zn-dependent protease